MISLPFATLLFSPYSPGIVKLIGTRVGTWFLEMNLHQFNELPQKHNLFSYLHDE